MSDRTAPEVLLSAEVIASRVAELGSEICADFAGTNPLLVCVLKGAFVFTSDLARAIPGDVEIDFMAVSSYGAGTASSGVVRILRDLDSVIEDRNVIIVEDILDTGLTLDYLRRSLLERGPRSVQACVLLSKQVPRRAAVEARYVGFEIPDRFVIGYGLDNAERWRNLPYVGIEIGF